MEKKEAMKILKDFYDKSALFSIRTALDTIIPELRGNDDERIRKELIEYFKHYSGGDALSIKFPEWIAWLEKQGEQHHVDKVEPKFKVGDWLQYRNAKPFFVEEITKQGYVNGDSYLPFNWENEIRLWTIQDAKDGDVLVTIDGKLPFIYKGCLDTNHSNCPVAYCGIDSENCFHISRTAYNHWWTDEKVQPATKEQRDTLMKAMTDEGYTFDFKKKKLKKIEGEKEILFGAKDSELQEVTYYIPKGFHAEIDDDKVVIKKD